MAKKNPTPYDMVSTGKSIISEPLVYTSAPISKKKSGVVPEMLNPPPLEKTEEGPPTLIKSILKVLNGPQEDSVERLAFEIDPAQGNRFHGLYRAKLRLLPDAILKRIAIQDDLIATCSTIRANQVGSFGRPRPNRHELGFVINPRLGVLDRASLEEKDALKKRISSVEKLLLTCGHTTGLSSWEQCTFSRFLEECTRNAVIVGRVAVEIISKTNLNTGEQKFHSFRGIDGGTIYRATAQKDVGDAIRREALHLLASLKNKDPKNKEIETEKFINDEYAWVQVINGRVTQAFTDKECVVHNFYPVLDVELDGYPITPIDTMIAAVTTHINITNHNKLYFQNGRASRVMLTLQSDNTDEGVVARIKQQFNASINGVNNAFRMPVFAIGQDDKLVCSPLDQGGRDMEFQFLSDSNCRIILAAFQMSPDEVPGYNHLAKGTNSQAISESGNEFKIEAARDVGIRPLLKKWEDFLNAKIMPLLDEKVAELCELRLVGLDTDTAEKEAERLTQDSPIHMTMDQILSMVEKDPVGARWGGGFLLNPAWQNVINQYLTVGEIVEHFFGVEGASQDPTLQYRRDPLWFQWQQMQQEKLAMQQAQQTQDPLQPGQPQGQQQGQPQQEQQTDLTRSLDQAITLLTKSEAQLSPSKKKILAQHKATIRNFVKGWEDDLEEASREILKVAEHFKPEKE